MPSARRRRWPMGYSTTTSGRMVPSVEFDGEGVGDGALGGVVVVGGELRVFDAGDGGAEVVDARAPDGIAGDGVVVVFGGEAAEDQGDGDHVLDAVVAVGGVVERALLVDDAHAGFVGADGDAGYVRGGLVCGRPVERGG